MSSKYYLNGLTGETTRGIPSPTETILPTMAFRSRKVYVNGLTGETTEDRTVAMRDWYRNGIPVEVWKDGKSVIRFNF